MSFTFIKYSQQNQYGTFWISGTKSKGVCISIKMTYVFNSTSRRSATKTNIFISINLLFFRNINSVWYRQWLLMVDILLVKSPWDEFLWTLLMIRQHGFRQWLGAVRQQAVTWANLAPDLSQYMAPQDHSEWNDLRLQRIKYVYYNTNPWWISIIPYFFKVSISLPSITMTSHIVKAAQLTTTALFCQQPVQANCWGIKILTDWSFIEGIHWWQLGLPHKEAVTRENISMSWRPPLRGLAGPRCLWSWWYVVSTGKGHVNYLWTGFNFYGEIHFTGKHPIVALIYCLGKES